MSKRLLPTPFWKEAKGAAERSKRLKLTTADENNLFVCPVHNCDSETYKRQRGCRKHVNYKHGWFYYAKPYFNDVFPERITRMGPYFRTKRCSTVDMPSFVKTCRSAVCFTTWLISPGGGGKDYHKSGTVTC